jgi:hypothetical protein
LESLSINGVDIADPGIPFCDYTNAHTIQIGAALHPGINSVVAVVRNDGGGAALGIGSEWLDPVHVVPLLLLVLTCVGFVLFLLRVLKRPLWERAAATLIIGGGFLRVFYLLVTPYWIRGHDTDGHIEYIRFIHDHWSLPVPDKGWEFWQPPLYYFVNAVWLRFVDIFHVPDITALFTIQLWSLALSVATLFILVWIARTMIAAEDRPAGIPLFIALAASFPALIFQASRINNDVLAIPLMLLALAFICAWWKTGKERHWILAAVAIGLGLLTKNTALLLLPIAFGCLLFKKTYSWKKKGVYAAVTLLIVVVLAGWFSVYRKTQDASQSLIIGNTQTLNSGLRVANNAQAYTVFNPIKVLQIPYNDAWNDASRRQYFWEYWYRSAFFGEFSFGDDRKLMASWLLFWGLVLTVVCFIGLVRSMLKWRTLYECLPLFFGFFVFPLGHLFFRYQFPYSSSEDFRYAVPVLASVFFFITTAILRTRSVVLRQIAVFSVVIFAGLCAMFLLHT